MLRVLQVCNVGKIVGGTAACAWTITKCLPECEHSVAFPGGVDEQTLKLFPHVELLQWKTIFYQQSRDRRFDIVIFQNTTDARLTEDWDNHFENSLNSANPVVVQYVHSRIRPARADMTWYCSKWLADQFPRSKKDILAQAVPKPKRLPRRSTRSLRKEITIGRICTPRKSKWPTDLISFYQEAAKRFEKIRWEFVGCPEGMKESLDAACGGKASFFSASWDARERLWDWDAMLYHNAALPESFGRTCAESMRAGCIPIVDSQGGFCEQIEDGTGFLCSNRDDFFEAIAQLQDDGGRRKRSRKCIQVGDERFSLTRMREEILSRLEKHTKQAQFTKRV